jgi:LPS-assembly protein
VTASSPTADSEIAFAADQLNYDSDSDIVTASGNVQMVREGNRLRADKVVWNRKTGAVEASGNVSTVDVEGNVAYGDTLQVTDTLRDGVVANLLLVMQQGGRLVARQGARRNGVYFLDQAAYTPCSVEDSKGCPKEPSWQIRAVKVRYDPVRQRVYYKGARIELFGFRWRWCPAFRIRSAPAADRASCCRITGSAASTARSLPCLLRQARAQPGHDADAACVHRPAADDGGELPGVAGARSLQHPRLCDQERAKQRRPNAAVQQRQFRGYIEGSGSYRFTPEWRLYGSLRRATDRTFLRRYNISSDDRLRSTLRAEHIDTATYFSLAGWSVQTMRLGDSQSISRSRCR